MNISKVTTENIRDIHVNDINKAIDAILNLDHYYECLPYDLSQALIKLNSLRTLAEEDIEKGDTVWDSFTGQRRKVKFVQVKNLCFDDGIIEFRTIGKKFCFKSHY